MVWTEQLVCGCCARSGAKFRKLKAKREAEEALPTYDPFLVPSINFP